MLLVHLSLLIIWKSVFVECSYVERLQDSTLIGGKVRIGLSNYSNQYQVLVDTAAPCDSNGSPCDPVFVVKIGAQQFGFEQQDKSAIFNNVDSLVGEFYSKEFTMFRELPDTLFISVTIEDNDAFSPVPQVIAQTVIELRDLLPSVPDRQSNAQTREVFCTPINKYVSFTLTAEVHCLPGQYGRRCSTSCDGGTPIYPTCHSGDASNCSRSLEIIGCTSTNGHAFPVTFQVQISVGVAVVAAFLVVSAIVTFAIICRKRQRRLARERDAFLVILKQQQSQHQHPPENSTEAQPATVMHPQRSPLMSTLGSSEFKNPVYHQQQERQEATMSAAHQVDKEEVYEQVEDGVQAPPLPPKN